MSTALRSALAELADAAHYQHTAALMAEEAAALHAHPTRLHHAVLTHADLHAAGHAPGPAQATALQELADTIHALGSETSR